MNNDPNLLVNFTREVLRYGRLAQANARVSKCPPNKMLMNAKHEPKKVKK